MRKWAYSLLSISLLLLSSLFAIPLLSTGRILSSPLLNFPAAHADDEATTIIVANDDFFAVSEDSVTNFLPVTGNDDAVADPSVSISILIAPINGIALVNTTTANSTTNASIIYTPIANFFGEDSFTYILSTDESNDTALVTVIVLPVNDQPIATDDISAILQNVTIDLDVTSNDFDIDGDMISISSIGTPAHGNTELTLDNDLAIRYTSNDLYIGQDSFTYSISDGNGGNATATVLIDVTSPDPPESPITNTNTTATDHDETSTLDSETPPITNIQTTTNYNFNEGPIALAGKQQVVNENTIVALNGSGSYDPDNDRISYSWNQTAGPSVSLNDANTATPTFTAPSVPESANDITLTFQLAVQDGNGGFVSDFVDIIVRDIDYGSEAFTTVGISSSLNSYSAEGPVFSATGSSYFSIADSSALHLQRFSLTAWFKTSSSFSGNAMIVNKGGLGNDSPGQNMNYGIWMNSGEKIVAGFETSTGTSYYYASPSSYNDGKWHYAVVTFNGSELKLFIDGKLITSKKTTAKPDTAGTQPLRLGANSRGSNNYFKGQIDEVKLLNRAVTSTEVTGLFKGFASSSSISVIPGEVLLMDGMTYYLAPIANAGSDQTIKENNYGNLDGKASSDPDNGGDNSLLTFLWTQVDGPSTAAITDPTSSKTTFKAPAVVGTESFSFQLKVSDGRYDSIDVVKITVQDDTSALPRILKTPDYMNDVASAIKSADDYVYAAMYYVEAYSSNKVINELAKAKARGVSVKLVIAEQTLDLYPNLPKTLKSKGIPFHIDSVHAKVVVIDGKLAYVGSANWNRNGLQNNWELTFKTNNPSTISEAKEYVNNLWHRGKPIVSYSNNYSERFVNGEEYVDLVVGYLKNAKSSIKVLMFEAQYDSKRPNSAPSKILWEVKNADKRGVDLKMVLDDPRYFDNSGGPAFFKKYQVPHKIDDKRSGYLEKKHIKAFLIDDSILVIGSHNWNKDSADSSQEASIITRNSNAIEEFKSIFDKQWNVGRWKIKP